MSRNAAHETVGLFSPSCTRSCSSVTLRALHSGSRTMNVQAYIRGALDTNAAAVHLPLDRLIE